MTERTGGRLDFTANHSNNDTNDDNSNSDYDANGDSSPSQVY